MKTVLLVVLSLYWTVLEVQSMHQIVIIAEIEQRDVVRAIESSLHANISDVNITTIYHEWKVEERSYNEMCRILSSTGISGIIDTTLVSQHNRFKMEASLSNIPYLKVDASHSKFLLPVIDYIKYRKGTSAILLTDNSDILYECLQTFLEGSRIEIVVANVFEPNKLKQIQLIRPVPQYFIAYGNSSSVIRIFNKLREAQMVMQGERWVFVISDEQQSEIFGRVLPFMDKVAFVIPDFSKLKTYGTSQVSSNQSLIFSALVKYITESIKSPLPIIIKKTCTTWANIAHEQPPDLLENYYDSHLFAYKNNSITYPLTTQIILKNITTSLEVGHWTNSNGIQWSSTQNLTPLKRHLKIGVVLAVPWLYYKTDEKGNFVKDPCTGQKMLDGFLVEFIYEISLLMNFKYELVISNSHGHFRNNNSWNGLVGMIVNGSIDMAIADLTVTPERYEVIDFVSPYFFHTGFAVIFRKPVEKGSLFKFMDVLSQEVWISIVMVLIITAFFLWFLEKYSPLSGRNNPEKYKEPVRVFNLMESLWFATTSFTPQGGGESPKSISGRILTAAYWLFVVLIITTFSANLAAFLTVERRRSLIQNLDDLAQESSINFTAVQNSFVHTHLSNLAKVDSIINSGWKEISLKDQRNIDGNVWKSPTREKFKRILNSIDRAGPVKTTKEGFDRVLNEESGLFAFIGDVMYLRHEFYSNCNYSYMTETFSERPLAMAVRQGNHLFYELSKTTVLLQNNDFLNALENKYWNASLRDKCQTNNDSEGITIRSLGGAFICTGIGILVSLVILLLEIFEKGRKKRRVDKNFQICVEYNRRKRKTKSNVRF